VDQQYKILVTHATYPNEDAFEGTVNFCLTVKKMLASCNIEKRGPLDIKFPKLCPEVLKAEVQIESLDCNIFEDGGGGNNTESTVSIPAFLLLYSLK
jgi:hypothetical protein